MALKREMKTEAFDSEHLEEIMNQKEYEEADNYLGSYFFKEGIAVWFRDNDEDKFIHYSIEEAKKLIPKSLITYCVVKRGIEYSALNFLDSTAFYKSFFKDFNEEKYFFFKKNDKG